ncbi:hypothetical protein LWI28_024198 [Acer negundo]|uniref:Protein FAR1-RELATED SEQUENCE n=1 Tax=Acer negundo TaxID=4023 RepID=A0AAD5NG39_ACENE|nr:hypothetical protein LWI28_024198 [Acer negundo]
MRPTHTESQRMSLKSLPSPSLLSDFLIPDAPPTPKHRSTRQTVEAPSANSVPCSTATAANQPKHRNTSEELEVESVDIQCGMNTEDGVDVEDGVNVEDGLNVDGGVNSSSRLEEPYIGKLFEDVEDVQAFYKAYARRVGFAIRTNHTRLSKDDKKNYVQ